MTFDSWNKKMNTEQMKVCCSVTYMYYLSFLLIPKHTVTSVNYFPIKLFAIFLVVYATKMLHSYHKSLLRLVLGKTLHFQFFMK